MNTFGKRSLDQLSTCHPDLIKVATEAIKTCPIDFGISEGHRSIADQQKAYREGKSQIDGITKKGNHNYDPALAFDFYAFVNGNLTYESRHMAFVAAWIILTGVQLGIILRWGGNWDSDSEIITDQSFVDLPHIELVIAKP
jgi:peptidoglycan L-alanyl-D-glutamate endopeptidase CwlK